MKVAPLEMEVGERRFWAGDGNATPRKVQSVPKIRDLNKHRIPRRRLSKIGPSEDATNVIARIIALRSLIFKNLYHGLRQLLIKRAFIRH
jgi:hypothetical protein